MSGLLGERGTGSPIVASCPMGAHPVREAFGSGFGIRDSGKHRAQGALLQIRRRPHGAAPRRRSALLTTDTELRLIASAAIIGDKVMPNQGYNTPAASGTPTAL